MTKRYMKASDPRVIKAVAENIAHAVKVYDGKHLDKDHLLAVKIAAGYAMCKAIDEHGLDDISERDAEKLIGL